MKLSSQSDKILTIIKIAFWILISLSILIILSVPAIFYLEHKGLIESSDEGFSDIIYSNGLLFIFSILGFLIVAIIFLIQHIISKYNADELEKLPMFFKYYATLLIVPSAYIMFNFVALYLKLGRLYELMSLIFSISLGFLIIIGSIFIYFNTRVSTVLGIASDDIIKFIRKNKKFNDIPLVDSNLVVSYSDDFVENLNRKISFFVENSQRAIKNNQEIIFRNSLESLSKICREYLEQSRHIQATEDKFLIGLSNRFNFIIDESLTSSNQNILEDVAKTIGTISGYIIEYRRGIGQINDFAFDWLTTLRKLFLKAYPKDRTLACRICLKEINKVIILTLDKGYYQSYEPYNSYIEEISKGLSKLDEHWAAALLQQALVLYQEQFLKFIDLLKKGKDPFGDIFIERYFNEVADIVNEAKIKHKPQNKRIVFASLYGIPSFVWRIQHKIFETGLSNIQDDKIKKGFYSYIKAFINFNRKVIETDLDKNDFRVYGSFCDTLFLLTKYVDIEENDKKNLIKHLTSNLLECIKIKYPNEKQIYKIEDVTNDYFAMLIYLHHNKVDIMEEIVQKLIDLYNKIKKQSKNNEQRLLYKKIKLYSCWIDLFHELEDINKPLIEVLIQDFYEPPSDRIFKSIPPLFETYGYPEKDGFHDTWYLNPSDIWDVEFQTEIAAKFNGENGENYINFHEKLKKESQLRRQNSRT